MIKYNPDYLHQEILTSKYNLKVALEHIDEGIQYEINRLKHETPESPETNYDSLNDVFELRDSVEKALEKVLEVLETLWKDFQTN